jgi:DNA polymerase elongation subunit (family B)
VHIGYRNATYNPRDQTCEIYTWSEQGDRISFTTRFTPYFFVEDVKGDDTSIYNTKVRKKHFNTAYDRTSYLKESGVRRVYENFGPVQQCLLDLYWKTNEHEDFSKFPLKIYYIDIEAVADTFPDPATAQHAINVITIFDSMSQKFYSWGLQPYNTKQADVVYNYCKSEVQLLTEFIEFFKKDPCDILSGWNSSLFDIPYIINRIKNILGDAAVNQLSPANRVYARAFMGKFGREQINYHIDGISCVDYMDIYKRFSFTNRESYKLDYIGELELGEKKIDYGERDLLDLMKEDWNLFVDYNIQDVNLLVKLEQKLQYNNLLRMIAYVGLTTFEGAMGTLSVITGSLAIRARHRGQRVSTFIRDEDDGSRNPGAYVAEPLRGFQESIVSFDANSLYPNVMISLNTSPETKVGKIIETDDDSVTIRHVNGQVFKLSKEKFAKFVKKEEIAISRAKVLFTQKVKGVVPDMVDHYYQKRKEVQAEQERCELELVEIEKQLKDSQ